jgi:hypothetical protein
MQINHKILSFNPNSGSITVCYFSNEVPDGLIYGIDLPIVNGAFVDTSEIEKLIALHCPKGQLKRIVELQTTAIPEFLMPYVPVPISLSNQQMVDLTVVPAAYGDKYFIPTMGQVGKDVNWGPTPLGVIALMLEAANVNANDVVYELGSGTGDISIAAAKLGATAIGIEYNPVFVNLANRKAEAAKVSHKTTFICDDLFTIDFSFASVVIIYLGQELNNKLKSKLQAMPKGTRIVSFMFDIEGWSPSKVINVNGANLYEWTVGA